MHWDTPEHSIEPHKCSVDGSSELVDFGRSGETLLFYYAGIKATRAPILEPLRLDLLQATREPLASAEHRFWLSGGTGRDWPYKGVMRQSAGRLNEASIGRRFACVLMDN
jgi:hypothetical protein